VGGTRASSEACRNGGTVRLGREKDGGIGGLGFRSGVNSAQVAARAGSGAGGRQNVGNKSFIRRNTLTELKRLNAGPLVESCA